MENKLDTQNIQVWKLNETLYTDDLLREIDINLNRNKLLDLKKNKYSILEKYVYDIALFHLKRLKIIEETDSNTNNIKDKYYIEFWSKIKYDTSGLHVDCDEYLRKEQLEYKYPLLSCVTYLNDSKFPTLITNIDMERYMYKDFEKDLSLFFSFPQKNKQITFDGKYFHGSAIIDDELDALDPSNEDRYILAINVWDKNPSKVDYYQSSSCNSNFTKYENGNDKLIYIEPEEFQEEVNMQSIGFDKDIINYKLFDDLLYKREKHLFKNLKDKVVCSSQGDGHGDSNSKITNYKVFLDESIEVKKLESQLKTKYGNIMDDAKELMNENVEIKYNRFLQRFMYSKIYCPNVCTWIINECEKYAKENGGWTKKRHSAYPTTDLPVESVKAISGFILESLKVIGDKIKNSYGLNHEIMLDFKDLFIVKYQHDDQNFLEIHKDGSFLSFNILLSDVTDFEGGGTYFDDGLIMKGQQGDLIIHSSRIKHSGLPITKGTRYLLVGFLNINLIV
jgi:hypothetical protein